jgi:hypothetical protein
MELAVLKRLICLSAELVKLKLSEDGLDGEGLVSLAGCIATVGVWGITLRYLIMIR